MDNNMVVKDGGEMVPILMSTTQLLARKKAIQELQAKVMVNGVDFGIIPGCKKPSLFKAGAETLNVTFGLRPVLDPQKDIVVRDLPGGHREYQVTVHIMAANSDKEIATGVGSCSTLESKYRYRDVALKCPKCGKAAIIKGKEEFGGGWVCWKKKEGCDAKFKDGDPTIEKQERGKVENEDPADQYNTCLKMAKKRGGVDGTINATAASHVFTQDVEDMKKELIKDAEFEPIKEPVEKKAEKAEVKAETSAGSEKTQGEAPVVTKQSTDEEKQTQILVWAQTLTGADPDKMEALFIKWGNFIPTKTKDGKLIPEDKRKVHAGRANVFDYTGKYLDVVFEKAESAYYGFINKEGN